MIRKFFEKPNSRCVLASSLHLLNWVYMATFKNDIKANDYTETYLFMILAFINFRWSLGALWSDVLLWQRNPVVHEKCTSRHDIPFLCGKWLSPRLKLWKDFALILHLSSEGSTSGKISVVYKIRSPKAGDIRGFQLKEDQRILLCIYYSFFIIRETKIFTR